MAWELGVKTAKNEEVDVYVTKIENDDYIKVKSVYFAAETKSFKANVALVSHGGKIEIHVDSLTGTLLRTCMVKFTGGLQNWKVQTCKVINVK